MVRQEDGYFSLVPANIRNCPLCKLTRSARSSLRKACEWSWPSRLRSTTLTDASWISSPGFTAPMKGFWCEEERVLSGCILPLRKIGSRKPSFTDRQWGNVQVLCQPIGIFLAGSFCCSHFEIIRAKNVRCVVQPYFIRMLIAYRLA